MDDLIKISIIQGSDRLLNELDQKVSKLAQKRLEQGKVKAKEVLEGKLMNLFIGT